MAKFVAGFAGRLEVPQPVQEDVQGVYDDEAAGFLASAGLLSGSAVRRRRSKYSVGYSFSRKDRSPRVLKGLERPCASGPRGPCTGAAHGTDWSRRPEAAGRPVRRSAGSVRSARPARRKGAARQELRGDQPLP